MASISFRHRDADTNTNTNTNADGQTSTVDPYFPILFSSLHDDPFLPLPELTTHFNIHSLAHQEDDTVSDPESVILNGPDLLDRENQAESTVSIHANAIRVVGFGSDSDSEDNQNSLTIDFNSGDDYGLDVSIENESFGDGVDYDDARVTIPLCWDSLQLEDHRENNEDFEWEEVDGRLDEREVLSMFIDEDEASVSLSISPLIAPEDLVSVERVGGLDHLEWQVLLNANNLDHDHNSEPYSGSHDDYIYTAESEMLFGQFTENENAMMGQPPATKSVVEKLPSVVFTKEDVESNNALCAVCKDDINVGERVKQLPCLHRYHGECIVPWLGIRNTCPVCRYELPTDDADYEQRKMAETSADHHL
ncbi:PREDICTED: E3 ubiquitin-protein ligase CIP8-like [Populus euphratica]|uniref:RING-type E3 ubiquitin transferase n=1 Tax=Populus euphratica TaxID=75702 RepID=A0AAJ6X9I5_POPEU|nr:PREDICTED: E3 ubiquitin-protein ligase CIP8-like [Populus euphratica]